MEPVVRVGVGVCIFKDGKILLGQRQKSSRRETLEESGVIISKPAFVTCTNDIFPDEGEHFITVYVGADWVKGEPEVLEPHKIAEWAWFNWDELPQPLFSPFTNLLKTGFKP
jgi:8-oxo-dGTP diphosphatase